MIRPILYILIILLGMAANTCYAADPAEELFSQAQTAINSGDYTMAISLLQQVATLPVATDAQRADADARIRNCRREIQRQRHARQDYVDYHRALSLFNNRQFSECINACRGHEGSSEFDYLITQCRDSIDRLQRIAQNNERLREQQMHDHLNVKALKLYHTMHFREAKAVYDSIPLCCPNLRPLRWTKKCDSIVDALSRNEAVDWHLVVALQEIQKKGEILHIGNLSDGFFIIELKNKNICLLRPDGEWKFLPNLTNSNSLQFHNGVAGRFGIFDGTAESMRTETRHYCYIDTLGNRILENEVTSLCQGEIYSGPFVNDYCVTWHYGWRDKQKQGIMNKRGHVIIPCKYDRIYIVKNGFVAKKGSKVILLSTSGNELRKFKGFVYGELPDGKVRIINSDDMNIVYDGNEEIVMDDAAFAVYKSRLKLNDRMKGSSRGYMLTGYDNGRITSYSFYLPSGKRFNVFVDLDGNILKKGKTIIENLDDKSKFSGGLAPVKLRGNQWSIVDAFGNLTYLTENELREFNEVHRSLQ